MFHEMKVCIMKNEAQIEQCLIEKLKDLKYVYRGDITDRRSLEENFRKHFDRLNYVKLSDSEFIRLRDNIITPNVFTASKLLRETNTFARDDDTPLQYNLFHMKDWAKNVFEVIHQLQINTENSNHRYDVILLVNGLPLVQIELKTLQVTPKKAMEQIINYKNDPGNGYTTSLLCFVQLFIVSNETSTYYFANNGNEHFVFNADERFLPIYEYADKDNTKITNLYAFADAFLLKSALGMLISKYIVLVASEEKLLIMRPYQIYAVKAIMACIAENRGNGYIWHTTGSGKTLTSFKVSTLLKDLPEIEKCLFVVDRKDLDRQTRAEFNRFQEGCVEENTNTETLVRRLISDDYKDKVIVTTIQKLGLALANDPARDQEKKRRGEPTFKDRLRKLQDKRMVIIFDECHRSQFGDNHEAIKTFFPKAQLFGFTGTPIFEENANYKQVDGTIGSYQTTKDVFEKELHSYTITNAIDDGNVLRFHIDYFKPDDMQTAEKADALTNKKRIVEAILAKHDAVTFKRRYNAIFATGSINEAITYFSLFKSIQEEHHRTDEDFIPLNIACVFSPPADGNKDVKQLQEDLIQEKADNEQEPEQKKVALKNIIDDYNARYGTNYAINAFDLYYQDVQQRIKDQQYANHDVPHKNKIDIVIVVDMLLTGFDSKYLNTLYVDKNLKQHGLIQAFSRTNRILNPTKPYGNIIDFRGHEQEVDAAIRLFSGKENSDHVKELWLVDPAPAIIKKLDEAVKELDQFMSAQGLTCKPEEVSNLKDDAARAGFIGKFKEIQRLKTQLDQYTDMSEEQIATIESLMPKDSLRAFRGAYLDVAEKLRQQQYKNVAPPTPEVENLDFEFVLFSSTVIDYDYIMALIAQYTNADAAKKRKMTKAELIALISSTSNLMDEREDIKEYIETLDLLMKSSGENKGLTETEVMEGYQKFKAARTTKEIAALSEKYGLAENSLQNFVDTIMNRMIFDGEAMIDLLEPLNLGWKERTKKELELMDDLVPLLKKIAGDREIVGLKAYE